MIEKHHEEIRFGRRSFLKAASMAGLAAAIPAQKVSGQDEAALNACYEDLANALNRLPNSFPRTGTQIEISLLKKIFSPEEAGLAGRLTGSMEPVQSIAKRAGLPEDETERKLKSMRNRGLLWGEKDLYRLAPFIVGIYESQVGVMDHELAHLFEEYMVRGGVSMMAYQPAFHRVIPVQGAVKSEWIMPYDRLVELMNSCNAFRVNDCICRKQQQMLGTRKCDFPLHVELVFYRTPNPPGASGDGFVSREEALAVLDQTEKTGLVHTVSNVEEGIFYVCNCCGCCCGILRGINEAGIEKSVAAANYYALIDSDRCAGCGTCVRRCQVHAISMENGISSVNAGKCIGCGLCATGCPAEAARLERKAAGNIVRPPKDFPAWEHERLVNRGML